MLQPESINFEIAEQNCFIDNQNHIQLQHCLKSQHEQSNIKYICTYENCTNSSLLGCVYCFIEEHEDHVKFKADLNSFQREIKINCKNIIEQLKKENYIDLDINLKSERKSNLDLKLTELKNTFLQCIDELQKIIYIQQLDNTNEKIQRIKSISNKNIWELNDEEIKFAMDVYLKKNLPIMYSCKRDLNMLYSIYYKNIQKIQDECIFLNLAIQSGVPERNMENPQEDKQIIIDFELSKNLKISIDQLADIQCNHFNFLKLHEDSFPIFPCCNKVYPCFKCHDKLEFHNYKTAITRLCIQCKKSFPKDKACLSCIKI